ncbi:ArnT family glycosyltransferase [Rhodophyticola sp. SM2404]
MRKTEYLWIGALVVLSILVFSPGFYSLPILDRDEARFVQTSAQMLQSGDYIDLRLGDGPRYNKPVGIYWLQSGFAALTGAPDLVQSYRAVSQIGAVGVVLMSFAIARLVLPVPMAFCAAALMGATLVLGGEARIGKTDAMLLFIILIAVFVVLRAVLRHNDPLSHELKFAPLARLDWGAFALFWGAIAASVLIKGPIVFLILVPILTFISWKSRSLDFLRYLRPMAGLLVFLALVLPWYVAITLRSDGLFWQASLMRDFLGKIHEGQEGHGAPFGTYLVLFWVTFFPASMVFAAGIPAIWSLRKTLWVQLSLSWILPTWLAFEIASTKLPHYVMPTYPAIAVMMIWALWQANSRPHKWALRAAALVGVVPLIVLGAFAFGANMVLVDLSNHYYLGGAASIIGLPLVWLMLARRSWGGLAVGAMVVSLGVSIALYPTLARMDRLWPSVALADRAAQSPDCEFWVAGYWEASLLFLTKRDLRFGSGAEIAAQADIQRSQGGCLLAAISDAERASFAALEPDLPAEQVMDLFNFGDGEDIRFHIFEIH